MAAAPPPTSSADKLPQSASADSTSHVASCHCGRVTLHVPSLPAKLNECRCTVCYKYGGLWAYYPRGDVVLTVAASDDKAGLASYIRRDFEGAGGQEFARCGHCGCMTHWWDLPPNDGGDREMGVNLRMLPEKELDGIPREVTYV